MIKNFQVIVLFLLALPVYADMQKAMRALNQGDFETAIIEFKKLAEQGNAKAQSHLGYLYYVGEGVDQDYARAVNWYRKAATQGDKDAQYNLAVAYAFGEGVTQDYKEAATWYRRAAEQGHMTSQYSLGISYIYGEGVNQDETEAAKWIKKSAEQGYESAQVMLGSLYHTGEGVEKDHAQAVYWYRKAADRGNASAQYNLGTMYRAGKGVEQDYKQAVRWFRLAADQGNVAAQNDLESMERVIAGTRKQPSQAEPPETTPAVSETPVESGDTAFIETQKQESVSSVTQQDATATPEPADLTDQAGAKTDSAFESETVINPDDITATSKQTPDPVVQVVKQNETAEQEPAELPDQADVKTDSPFAAITRIDTQTEATESTEQKKGFFSRLFGPGPKTDEADVDEQIEETTETVTLQDKTETLEIDEPDTELPDEIEESNTEIADEILAEVTEETPVADIPVPENKPVELEEETTLQDAATVHEKTDIDDASDKEQSSGGLFGLFGDLFSSTDQSPETQIADTDIETKTRNETVAETDTADTLSEQSDITQVETEPDISIQKPEETTAIAYAEGSAPADQQLVTLDNKENTVQELPVSPSPSEEEDLYLAWNELLIESPESIYKPVQDDSTIEVPVQETEIEAVSEAAAGDSRDVTALEEEDNPGEVSPVIDKALIKEDEEALIIARLDDTTDMPSPEITDDEISLEILKPRAIQGDLNAQYRLATLYYTGSNVGQDYARAFLWYRRAAIQGHPDAQYSLANMYLIGEGTSQNDVEAYRWYEKAAAQGHLPARNNLENLKHITLESDNEVAETETEPEVDAPEPVNEIDNGENFYNTGMAFNKGEGVSKDHTTAFSYFEKAAALNYAPAQFELAQCYEKGLGIEQDHDQAIHWYTKSAINGYAIAQRTLGHMYLNGVGIAQDKIQAYAWLSILSEQGNVMDVHRRDTLKKELSDNEINQAEALILEIRKNHDPMMSRTL